MGRQRQVYRPVELVFPRDFPERLERFKVESKLSWRSLARLLGVSPYRIREWRRGIVPDSTHLFFLLTLADRLGLRGISFVLIGICPEVETVEITRNLRLFLR